MANQYVPSDAARRASDYFNALPIEQRKALAPLLEHHRQMGLAEAADHARRVVVALNTRIEQIQREAWQ